MTLVLLAVAAFVVSALSCGVVLRLSTRRGWVDAVGGEAHKRHDRVVPNTGGVGVSVAVVAPMLAAVAVAWLVEPAGDASWAAHLPGVRSVTPALAWLLAVLLALHVLGLVDDRRRLSAWPKLLVQVAAAVAVVVFADVRALTLLDDAIPGGVGYAASALVTTLWLVAVTNAINFLDNMDGLAGGVAAIVAAVYLAMAALAGQWFVAGAAACVLGACAGFLLFNFPPARLFMGDGGSLVLGFLLAVIAVRTTYFSPGLTGGAADTGAGPAWHGVLTPLVVLAVPLYDFLSVTIIRLSQGASPMRGDHQHVSHRLAEPGGPGRLGLGLGRRGAVAVVCLCTAATAAGGVLLPRLGPLGAAVVAVQTLAILGLLAGLERPWRRLGTPPADDPATPTP